MAMDAQVPSRVQNLSQNFAEAFNRGDFAAVGAFYAKDAVLLPPGAEAIDGQSNIQMFWGRNRRIQEMRFEPLLFKPLGSGAVRETGGIRFRFLGGQQRPPMVGKYIAVWQEVDGDWKLEAFMWNRSGGNPARGQGRQGARQQGGTAGSPPRGQGGGGRWGGPGQGGGGQQGGRGPGPGGRGVGRRWRGSGDDRNNNPPAPFVPRIDD
jgi:ketosteroid isomerase-like protein